MTTVAELLSKLTMLVSTPRCSAEMKAEAIQTAYEMGKTEGRLEGAKDMGERLVASIKAPTT